MQLRHKTGQHRMAAAAGAFALAALVVVGSAWARADGARMAVGKTPTPEAALFDDFDYPSADLGAHGWYVRSGTGRPGALAAGWSPAAVSIVADPAQGANRLLRLEASTDGTVAGTVQAEVGRRERRFREGTYAARIRF